MTNKLFFTTLFLLCFFINGCEDEAPEIVDTSELDALVTDLESQVFARNVFQSPALVNRYLVHTDEALNAQYYTWTSITFFFYDRLKLAVQLEEKAKASGLKNYQAVGKLFQSYIADRITQLFGDVPYSEVIANGGELGQSKYDTQKDIYIKVLNDLREVNEMLDPSAEMIGGDIVYNGDVMKWRKLSNVLRLRFLIGMSLKTNDPDLDIIGDFKEIVENPNEFPIFTSNDDNTNFYFDLAVGQEYPFFDDPKFKTSYFLDAYFVDLLKERADPRLFKVAEPEKVAIDDGVSPTSFEAFNGIKGSNLLAENQEAVEKGNGSPIHPRYHTDPANEPSLTASYFEQEFTLAEAAQLGWINSDPETHYKNGIVASMEFYNIEGNSITDYLQQPKVAFSPNDAMNQILTQKYLALFLNTDWLGAYSQRRTGLPALDNSGTGVQNGGIVPKRWSYPDTELESNQENVTEAINRQFGGVDDINGLMWVLQE